MENYLEVKIVELWLFEFRTVESVVVAEAVVLEAVFTKSMGNTDFYCLLAIKSSHLCIHKGYKHGFGLKLQLHSSTKYFE